MGCLKWVGALALGTSLLAGHAQAAAELVTNGDFETGNFAGWTKSGVTSLSDVIANTVTSNTSYLWRSGATGGLAYISQDIATEIGATYDFSFDVYSTSTTNTVFEVYFGGIQVFGFSNEVHNWTHILLEDLPAISAVTEIKLGARNDPSFTRVDNVSVMASSSVPVDVPEPASGLLLAGAVLALSAAGRGRKAG